MEEQRNCPYRGLPDEAYWKDGVSRAEHGLIDPHFGTTLRFDRTTRIASAGSCFAQRISTALRRNGFSYMVSEPGPPWLGESDRSRFNYGTYSARYGNIYTTLQLLQLFQRAFGQWDSTEPLWTGPKGEVIDPFRPNIQPEGFSSEAECLNDRREHLEAVRHLLENVDVLVFTLGLTEGWQAVADGAMLPVCPGCGSGGSFDPSRYRFCNFSPMEIIGHLEAFVACLKEVNPRVELLLTVSPVPLVATFEPRHVLQSTTYSKSVLRVAAEHMVRAFPQVHYFASYEIVTATGNNHRYFAADQRSVTDAAVNHVMWSFFRQFTTENIRPPSAPPQKPTPEPSSTPSPDTAPAPPVVCDEDTMIEAMALQMALRK